jgi:hypothetical protein
LAEDVLRELQSKALPAVLGMYRQGVQASGAPVRSVAAKEAHGPADEPVSFVGCPVCFLLRQMVHVENRDVTFGMAPQEPMMAGDGEGDCTDGSRLKHFAGWRSGCVWGGDLPAWKHPFSSFSPAMPRRHGRTPAPRLRMQNL